jgi:hypothetical protein
VNERRAHTNNAGCDDDDGAPHVLACIKGLHDTVRPPPGWDVGEGAGESEDTGVGMGKGVGVGEDKGAGMVERHTHIMLLFYVIHFVTIINTIFVHLDGWLSVVFMWNYAGYFLITGSGTPEPCCYIAYVLLPDATPIQSYQTM